MQPQSTQTVIIANISPCARDAIHTRNTLMHVVALASHGDEGKHASTSSQTLKASDTIVGNGHKCRSGHVQNNSHEERQEDCILDLPLQLFYTSEKKMEAWSTEDVRKWLGHAAGGRFAKIVLPDGKADGKGLLSYVITSSTFVSTF